MMKVTLQIVAFAAVASAAVLRRDQCCFQITASGDVSGVMGQLSDGQNRINGSYAPATYCYNNGGIVDSHGRGCVVTYTNDATHQFQCDLNSPPTYGFSIASNGSILYQGSDQFYACPATNTEYNVYTTWLRGQDKCMPIKLSTNGTCAGASRSGGVPAGSSSVGVTAPAYSTAASTSKVVGATPPQATSTAPAYSTGSQVVPVSSHSAPSAPESAPTYTQTPVVPATVPTHSESSSVPGYSAPPVSVESSPTQNGPEDTTPAIPVPQTQSVHTHGTTVTAQTTYYTTKCPVTETQVSSGSTFTNIYSTWSTMTAVHSPTTEETTNVASTSSVAPTSIHGYGSTTSSSSSEATTPATSSYSQSSSTPVTPTGSTSASACQTSLSGAYQTPHLIVPISSSQPDKAYGTQYNATINSEESTIFNFDIPSSYQGKKCSVIFLFPEQADLETSAYTFSGSGSLVFEELNDAATTSTTYDNAPAVKETLDTIAIQPGNSYVVATTPCAAGTTESIELSSSGGLSLEFFEDWNPSSLGLYITSC